MSDLTKLGTSLLDMDEISQYLWKKGVDFTNKTYPDDFDANADAGFILRGEKAGDTKKVGGKNSYNIAVAYEDSTGNVSDRTTVRNATTLNNYPLSSFVLQSEKQALTSSLGNVSDNFLKEIRDLRDELYQLRAELSKNGTVQAYKPYAGFYDTFRTQYPVHMSQPVTYANADSSARNFIKVTDAAYELFQKGDYLFLVSDEGESCIVKIESLGDDHHTLNFTHSANFDIATGCKIYKSHGNIINGAYTFGKINVRSVDLNNKVVSTVNDDTNLIMRTFPNSPSTGNKHVGFAFTFRIPEAMQGNYLVNLELMGKQYGAPGDMICYIIDERDADKWRNPAQAFSDGLIVAKSAPVKAESEINITQSVHAIQFNFYDESTGEYPFIEKTDTANHRTRYLGIIDIAFSNVSEDLLTSDTYSLYFVRGTDGDDLETNNLIFGYSELNTDVNENNSAFSELNFIADLYYSLTFAKANISSFVPFNKGIYTARFDTSYPIESNMARLTMRIAREGLFTILPEDISRAGEDAPSVHVTPVPYQTSTGNYVDNVDCFRYCRGKNVIVGLNARGVTAVEDSCLTLNNSVRVRADDLIYPMNYEIYLTARATQWNMKTQKKDVLTTKKIPMSLKCVQPDQFINSDVVSDRLIFECDFSDDSDTTTYNDFELQLYWETSAKNQNDRNIGRIFDLSVTLNKVDVDVENEAAVIPVTRPSVTGNTVFPYDGTVKNLQLINDFSGNFVRTGSVSGVDAKKYSIRFTLNPNCVWSDNNSKDDYVIEWQITKAANSLTISPNSLNLSEQG